MANQRGDYFVLYAPHDASFAEALTAELGKSASVLHGTSLPPEMAFKVVLALLPGGEGLESHAGIFRDAAHASTVGAWVPILLREEDRGPCEQFSVPLDHLVTMGDFQDIGALAEHLHRQVQGRSGKGRDFFVLHAPGDSSYAQELMGELTRFGAAAAGTELPGQDAVKIVLAILPGEEAIEASAAAFREAAESEQVREWLPIVLSGRDEKISEKFGIPVAGYRTSDEFPVSRLAEYAYARSSAQSNTKSGAGDEETLGFEPRKRKSRGIGPDADGAMSFSIPAEPASSGSGSGVDAFATIRQGQCVLLVNGEPQAMGFLVGQKTVLTDWFDASSATSVLVAFSFGMSEEKRLRATVLCQRNDVMTFSLISLNEDAPGKALNRNLFPPLHQRWRGLVPLDTSRREMKEVSGEIAGFDDFRMSLKLDRTIPRASSGAPLCVGDDVFAMLDTQQQAQPLSLLLCDRRVREALNHKLEAPRLQVAVVGAGGSLQEDEAALAVGIGRVLQQASVGLVCGGYRGIDEDVARGMYLESMRQAPAAQITIVTEGRTYEQLFAGGKLVPSNDWVGDTVSQADLIVLCDGGSALELVRQVAREQGKPIVMMSAVGQTATSVHEKIGAELEAYQIPGYDLVQHQSMVSIAPEERLKVLASVVEAVTQIDRGPQEILSSSPVRATVSGDGLTDDDLLDNTKFVDAFAHLIASKDLTPPLAIGLFGEWGSGKSFFMERLKKGVKALGDDNSQGHYWEKICQIHFNAWHYMDANLWVSLAGHIFDSLASELRQEKSIAETRKELLSQLASIKEARDLVEEERKELKDRLEDKNSELLSLQSQMESKRLEFDQLGELIKEMTYEQLGSHFKALKENVKKLDGPVADQLKLAGILENTQDLRELFKEIRSNAGQFKMFLRDKNIKMLCMGLVVALGPPIIDFLLDIAFEGNQWAEKIDLNSIGVVMGQVGLILGGVISKLKDQLETTSEGLKNIQEQVEKLQEEGRVVMEGLNNGKRTVALTLREEIEAVRMEIDRREKERDSLEERIGQIEEQLAELDGSKLVYDFLAGRTAEDGPYRSREGIVSIVRRDLEQLARLIQEWRRQSLEESEREELKHDIEDVPDDLREKLPIQRIVLYIDDLDRCPPAKVVDVLQAVHLLLAFDLFVVVVGVDPRWLERSLTSKYGDLIGGKRSDQHHYKAADPHDYLEKIFQIPFTLPRIDKGGFGSMMQHYLKTRKELVKVDASNNDDQTPPLPTPSEGDKDADPTDVELTDVSEENMGGQGSGDGPATNASNNELAITVVNNPSSETSVPPVSPSPGGNTGGTTEASPSAVIEEDGAEQQSPEDESEVDSQKFFIESVERDFMEKHLYQFIRTPRLAKRFVNVYKMLRTVEVLGASDEDYSRFVNRESSAVLLLLAASVGFPKSAGKLLRVLGTQSIHGTGIKNFLENFMDDPAGQVLDLNRKEKEEMARLKDRLLLVVDQMRQAPPSFEIWVCWANRVGRFSMYWHG